MLYNYLIQILFIKLNTKIDFSASDEKFVDIIFSIITPETSQSEHLLILSAISNFLKKKGCIEKLRKLNSAEEIYKLFGLAQCKLIYLKPDCIIAAIADSLLSKAANRVPSEP